MAKYNKKKYRESKRPRGPVRAKKHLGQHFLKDETIASKIANSLSYQGYDHLVEIGPGTGILTKFLLTKPVKLLAMDLDQESIKFLNKAISEGALGLTVKKENVEILHGDFLKFDLISHFGGLPFAVIGNFPYNISTQILFKVLEWRTYVPEFAGMFQKEVAQRICAGPGSKTYGILSVLTQAFYTTEYLFSVSPGVFHPPPKVESGVIRLERRENFRLSCDEALFFRVVKTAFNQRRKTLRNSLKAFQLSDNLKEDAIFGRRPEELAVAEFTALTEKIKHDTV